MSKILLTTSLNSSNLDNKELKLSVPMIALSIFLNLKTLQPWPATLFKTRLWYRCFPVSFAKFLRTPFLIEYLQWLLVH